MSGPYTTITVELFCRLQDVARAAESAELGHGANCLAMATKPCTCGLEDLDVALGELDATTDTNDDQNGTDQHAE